MFRKVVLLVSGNAFGSALLLVRNLAVAALVSVEDYGIASTFAMAMAIVEVMSQFGLHQLIVQDKDGDNPRLQAGLQGFNALRGCLSGLLLFAVAYPLANFMGVPQVAWAYQVVAVLPALYGFVHFDMHRVKRRMKFLPSTLFTVIPALVSVLMVWPLAWWLGDYRVMLYSMVLQGVMGLIVSHLVAERPYRMSLDRDLISRSVKFGWPLLINALLLFAIFNGEKVIVGRELGMVALAIFAMGFTLTLTPTLVLAGSVQSFFLPMLSKAQDEPARFNRLSNATIEAGLAIGVLLILGICLLGGPLIHLLLGQRYEPLIFIMIPLGVVQAIRVCKVGSATVALARARTGNSLIANSFRVFALPFAWWIASTSGNMIHLIWTAIIAETIGFAVALYLVNKRVNVPLRGIVLPSILSFSTFITAMVDNFLVPPSLSFIDNFHASQIIIVVLGLSALFTMRELSSIVRRKIL